MPCYSPVAIRSKRKSFVELGLSTLYKQVPCGKCLGCLKVRQMQYAFRMEWEALDPRNKDIKFVTLTYAPEFLPPDNELSVLEVQRYVRRLKKFLPCGCKMRYAFCGEHGDLKQRAHYHAILFFSEYVPDYLIYKAWKMGRVDIQEPNLNRFGYVAKYSTKQLGDSSERWIQPPFLLISNEVGFYFLEKHGDFCRKNLVNTWINASGYHVMLPRVFMERLFPPRDKVHCERMMDSDAAFVYYTKFVGNKSALDYKRKSAYDARVSVESSKRGLSVAAFQGLDSLGKTFLNFNKRNAIFSRVRYETGRY